MLCLLADSGGCPAILKLELPSGKSSVIPLPDAPETVDERPFYSLLSSRNRYYTAFGGNFYEYDVESGAISFHGKISGRLGMGMCEDDNGKIWVISYPASELCSFDPETRTLVDFGSVYPQTWNQYQRFIAADDKNFIYFGLGNTEAQIISFDPQTRTATPLIPDEERPKTASGEVFRAKNGKVYGHCRTSENKIFFELHQGKATRLTQKSTELPVGRSLAAGMQNLLHRQFPDGSELLNFDLAARKITLREGDKVTTIDFSYDCRGAYAMGLVATADGKIIGGASHPMAYFVFDAKSGKLEDGGDGRYQWNSIAVDANKVFVSCYPGGALLEWDTRKPFCGVPENEDRTRNPVNYGKSWPVLDRPGDLKLTPDGAFAIAAGTPGYGRSAGGLGILDRRTQQYRIVGAEDLLIDESPLALAPLPDQRVLIGGTVTPGTGGRQIARTASLSLYNLETGAVEKRIRPFAGVSFYLDFLQLDNGLILGVADRDKFFLFDPVRFEVIDQIGNHLGNVMFNQGARVLLKDGKRVFILFRDAIGEFDPVAKTITRCVRLPEPATAGGAICDGKIFFLSNAKLFSWQIK